MRTRLALLILTVVIITFGIWRSGAYLYVTGAIQNFASTEAQVFQPVHYFPAMHNAKAVVLIAHGLNLLPSKMDDIANFLQANNYDVYRLALSGHRGNFEELKHITRQIWLEDFAGGYKTAKERAGELNIPIYFLGYSLGGVLAVDSVVSDTSIRFEKIVLFAPAISVYMPSWVIRMANKFSANFLLPSSAPREVRANDKLTVRAYGSLFESIAVATTSDLSVLNVPTKIFIDAKDELVSEAGIKKCIQENKLSQWSIDEVSIEGTEYPFKKHHLIIDKLALGPVEWARVTDRILTFYQHL